MVEKASIVDKLLRKFLRTSPPPVSPKRPIVEAVNKLLRYAKSSSVGKIGIHGAGGIGKTSVLKALIDCPEIKKRFDTIILATISRHWGRRHLQAEIAEHLSLSLEDSEPDEHIAAKLRKILSTRKFLLVLDDVWECIDLDGIGIPHENRKSGCKVVLAAREVKICHAMAVDKEIKMGFLSSEEAEKLFCDQLEGSTVISSLQAMVEECCGLPLLVIVIGRAMKKNNNWQKASQDLQNLLSLQADDDETRVVHLLKFSYDRLMGPEAKKCFLYATSYQESQEITVSEFVKSCIREGLISGNSADALERGRDIVEDLIDACLLETVNNGQTVKMHKVIRDLALLIMSTGRNDKVSKCRDLILSRASAGLTEPPPEKDWGKAEKIFLNDNKFSELREIPSCPKLLMLFLQNNINLKDIPDNFFENMPCLQVLNLSKSGMKSLPPSLFKIRMLKKLILRDCPFLVELPGEIGNLEHLEVLDVQGTEICKLPCEIGNLSILRNLLVSFYGPIVDYNDLPVELIPLETISRLLALNELVIIVRPGDSRWNRIVGSITEEVADLKNLAVLHFYFPDIDVLEFFIGRSPRWAYNSLIKFKFVVGHINNRSLSQLPKGVEIDYDHEDQCLRFMSGEGRPDSILMVLHRATSFYLDHHLTATSLSEFGLDNMKDLKFCIVNECLNMNVIIDDTGEYEMVLPFLKHLSIHSLWNLRSIWQNPMPSRSFGELEILEVNKCPKLTCIFTPAMLEHLYNLKELVVEDCGAVNQIIQFDLHSDKGVLSRLRKLTLRYLPDLIEIGRCSWRSLEQIKVCSCPNLTNLRDFQLAKAIKKIEGERDWWDGLLWEDYGLFSRLEPHFTLMHRDEDS